MAQSHVNIDDSLGVGKRIQALRLHSIVLGLFSATLGILLLSASFAAESQSVRPAVSKPVTSSKQSASVPTTLKLEVEAGRSATTVVKFQAKEDASSAEVWVTPNLRPYLSASPTLVGPLRAGQPIQIALGISASATALPLSVSGTVQLRNSTRSSQIDRPLSVAVTVVWPTVANLPGGIAVAYPPTLTPSIEAQTGALVLKQADGGESVPDVFVGISVSLDSNPNDLSIEQYYNGLNGDDLGLVRDMVPMGSTTGYRFFPPATMGGDVVVVARRADGAFVRVVDYGAAFQRNGLFQELLRNIKLGG